MSAIVKVDTRHYRVIAQEHWGLTDEQMEGMHVHHRIHQSEGGSNDPSNLFVCSPWFHAHVWHTRMYWIETAAMGGAKSKGRVLPEEQKRKISSSLTGIKKSEATRAAMSRAKTGVPMPPMTDEHKAKLSAAGKGPKPKVTCPHCGKVGGNNVMKRHHFDNCKHRVH